MNNLVSSIYKKSILTLKNVWFAEACNIDEMYKQARNEKIDIIILHGIRYAIKTLNYTDQYTLFTDLSLSEDNLFAKITKNYRYEINRTEKENILIKAYSSTDFLYEKALMDTFEKTYNRMYSEKGMNVVFNRKQFEAYLHDECLIITVGFWEGTPCVFHSYIFNEMKARLLYSTSNFRSDKDMASLIGRINKALHWYDIKMLKKKGILLYDWGGISDRNASNGIDKFKISFGGYIEKYYNIFMGISLKGKAVIILRPYVLKALKLLK